MRHFAQVKSYPTELSERLIIFAKAPRAGEVKTRLVPQLGKEGALAAYITLLKTLVSNLNAVRDGAVFYSPEDGEVELQAFFPKAWQFQAQSGADLGERLTNAFRASLRDARKVIAIGSDCPYVTADDVQTAFESLTTNDLVIGPATDGGYWLIGMKRLYASLFEGISWGTERVLEQTLKQSRALSLRTRMLRKLTDIDTLADWEEFCRTRKTVS